MLSWLFGAWRAARIVGSLPLFASFMLLGLDGPLEWPGPEEGSLDSPMVDHDLIQAQRVCIVNTSPSAGDIGKKLVFRSHREGDRLSVSYFVYWSTESPWGDQSVLLSLAIDSTYSHFFFVLPGLRYLLYGPGDIEGATVIYRVRERSLEVVEGIADSALHQPVTLSKSDLTDPERGTMLTTNVWSHQLGGRVTAATAVSQHVARRCYEGSEIVPLTSSIATRFRLGSAASPLRAKPAWR